MSALSRWLGRIVDRSIARFATRSKLAQSVQQDILHGLKQQERYADLRRLTRFEHQVFSQGGEDGAIREIFRRIGESDRVFVEIGAGTGIENNTACLLCQGWRGVWLEASRENCDAIRAACAREIHQGRLTLIETAATAENVSAHIRDALPTAEFDLLSIDIDRNTYHVWAALETLKPRVVVVEYNALFPADMIWIANYDPAKWWNGTAYFGASLKALEILATRLGYALVGCDIAGVNAFFVRGDLVGDAFCAPFTAENHYEPIRYYLHARVGYAPALHD